MDIHAKINIRTPTTLASRFIRAALSCFVFLSLFTRQAMADARTSFEPGAVWPDDHGVHINAHGGGILLHHGVYYWFGEHKIAGEAGNVAQVGVHVYSSRDLYNWKDEGIALPVSTDPA